MDWDGETIDFSDRVREIRINNLKALHKIKQCSVKLKKIKLTVCQTKTTQGAVDINLM